MMVVLLWQVSQRVMVLVILIYGLFVQIILGTIGGIKHGVDPFQIEVRI
jgi:hypothetical protein